MNDHNREPGRIKTGPERDARLVVAVGAVAVILLVIGLVASGAFSGSPAHHATTSTPTPTTAPSARSTPATSPASPSPPTSTLTPGTNGAQTKLLQRALAALGYSPGGIDGSYGPSTQQALKRFQQAHGLPADGVLGPKTLAALTLALRP